MPGSVVLTVRGVLFDMDGVLISSIGSVTRCWRQWAAEYEVPGAANYEVPHGMRAVEIVRHLRPDIDENKGLQRIEDLELLDLVDLKVLPGADVLLRSLPPDRWAIVTSATRRLLIGRLEAAGLPVPERLISADMVSKGKPDPEPYMRGAALVHAEPADCVVVEDAPSGVRAGVAAGCNVLGVRGTHSEEELLSAGAHWVVRSLEDVHARVKDGALQLEMNVS